MKEYAIYLGRFSPIHKGHQRIIENMLEKYGTENCIILIGSCANKLDDTLFFTYSQRKQMLKTLYPNIGVVGLPDYKNVFYDPSFKQWHENLWDIIKLKFPDATIENTIFQSGSEQDSYFYKEAGYKINILNRFDGEMFSASEIRMRLVYEYMMKEIPVLYRPIEQCCDAKIVNMIIEMFLKNKNLIN